MMKKIGKFFISLFFIYALADISLFASDVEISLDNNRPIKGEQFSIIFKINMTSEGTPYISFDPFGVEVLRKRSEGTSIQSTIMNGRFVMKKQKIIAYDLIASSSGQASLKNITVEIGDKSYNPKNVKFRVYDQAKRARQLFVQAEIDKKQYFVGEGFDVDYYLYTKIPVFTTEVVKFPTFNNFLKRDFLDKKERARVNLNGYMYEKVLLYSVRLYAEKAGNISIDPLRINAVYEKSNSNSPFFGGRRYSKELVSEKIKIKSLPLPVENLPPTFTGLVGKHNFKLALNKEKFLVNEAIGLKLEVTGPGALEKLDLPDFYDDPNLETFNSTSELNTRSAKPFKITEITYLGRNKIEIDKSEKTLYYFDPDNAKYVGVKLTIPSLKVVGGNIAVKTSGNELNRAQQNTKKSTSLIREELDVIPLAPLFEVSNWLVYRSNYSFLIFSLFSAILILLLLELIFRYIASINGHHDANSIYLDIKKKGLTYSKLYSLLLFLFRDKKTIDIQTALEESSLGADSKNYFLNLLRNLEEKKFSNNNERKKPLKVNKKMFKQLLREINATNQAAR